MNAEAAPSCADEFTLERDGFAWRRAVLDGDAIDTLLRDLHLKDAPSPNRRSLLRDCPAVAHFAGSAPLQTLASEALGGAAFAVRALLFDKVSGANWSVPWHQDLAIAVEELCETPGFSGWSVKDGIPHVLPPADVLRGMVTLRLHLDACGEDNGPLRVLPGSHAAGRLDDAAITAWRNGGAEIFCTAARGDVLLMRPLLLHASSAARRPAHRRVLHLEYAAHELPGGLRWFGQRVEKR